MTTNESNDDQRTTGLKRLLPPDWMMNAAFAIAFLTVVAVTILNRDVNEVGFNALIVLMSALGGYQVRGLK